MPRVKKEEKEEEVVEAKSTYSLVAKYRVIDPLDGAKSIAEYSSEGTSPEDLLKNLDFPKGVNALVSVTVKKGKEEYTRSLAPFKARQVLEFKQVEDLRELYRGIV
jgi:hypothetical protein